MNVVEWGEKRTSESKANVVIEHDNFAHCARVLQLENRFLFDTEDYNVFAAYANLGKYENQSNRVEGPRTAQVPFLTASAAYST